MKRIFLGFVIMLSLSSFQSVFGQQETGRIGGTVSDVNKGAVPNASVTIKSTTTGFSRSTTTDSDGEFVFVNVQPGKYDVSVKISGFA